MEDLVFGRRYRVIEKIGSGGMADVFKAVDDVLGRTVAVKVLHARYASEPNFVARFRQEAQSAANLSHPNIVNMYDWGRDEETYYIVMEYVKGVDFKTLITQRGALDPLRVAEYGAQVCSALATAHGYDIIHRDIKPHNIVIQPDGTVKVMDFGIARAGNTTMTQTGSVMGTAQYVSPEQAQGKPLGPASDLYSLGITLYEMATGRPPFDADTPVATALMHVNDDPIPPRRIQENIPPALEAVILRALRKNPAERYASAKEMRDDLQRVAAGQPIQGVATVTRGALDETSVMPAVERAERVRAASAPEIRAVPERRTSPWVWVGIVAALAVIGFIVAAALGAFSTGPIVPSVIGDTEERAEERLIAADLTLGQVTTENSDEYELGVIMGQDPEAGTRVLAGSAVNIIVSAGVAQLLVPDLTLATESDALDALAAAELELGGITRENSVDVPEGQVIRTEPAAGTEVPKGSKVTVFVSKGILRVQVPDVTNKTLADAKADLETLSLVVKSTEAFSDSVPKGRVIKQSPEPKVYIDAGSTVTLTISKGPEVIIVPDLVDMDEMDARAELESLGLKHNTVYTPSPDDGIVLAQNPIAGASARRGDTITITVGETPAP